MRPRPSRPSPKVRATLPGVIDLIADGLSIVLERPLLMAIPMLLDLYYWLGWKVTANAMTSSLQRWVTDRNMTHSRQTVERLASAGRSDLLWLLSLFVPALLTDVKRSDVYTIDARPVVSPAAWLDVALLPLVVLASLAVAMIYWVPLADCIAHRRRSLREMARAVAVGSVRLLAALGIALGIVLLVSSPLLIGSLALEIAGVDPSVLLALTLVIAVVGAGVVFQFIPEAIVVSEVGPLRAIANSVAVVRGFFWQTLGLVVATFIITAGLGSIFQRLAYTPPGLLVGVIGNAFFGTGLEMASMGFYANRIRSLRPGGRPLDRDMQAQTRP